MFLIYIQELIDQKETCRILHLLIYSFEAIKYGSGKIHGGWGGGRRERKMKMKKRISKVKDEKNMTEKEEDRTKKGRGWEKD